MRHLKASLTAPALHLAFLLTVFSCGVHAQTSNIPARITQAIDETLLVRLRGNVHPLARPEFDRGPVSNATPMKRMLLLLQRSPEQEAALRQFMDEQLSKESPNFQKWLTPQEFGKLYGPADADIQTITGWLASRGFVGMRVNLGKTVIEFSGNVGQVRSAFHTDIHKFVVNGEERQANTTDPQIPAALTPVVAEIASLHNFPMKSAHHVLGPFRRTADGRIEPLLTGAGGSFYALGPADFAKIYNIPPSLDGTGGNVAIIGLSTINVQDVHDFRALFALPINDPVVVNNGPDPGFNGVFEREADLDVQWSGAVAPKATIHYVLSEGTLTSDPLILGVEYVIDNNSDDVMSLSFNACESALLAAGNAFVNSLWEQAAAQGITVTVAAGDGGSAGCDDFNAPAPATHGIAVNGLASTPFNIAVGGTDFDDAGTQTSFWSPTNAAGTRESALGYIHEVPWNISCAAGATSTNLNTVCAGAAANNIVAGSGGPSILYAKPSFQSAITPNGIAASDNHRYIPDVSLFAGVGSSSNSFYVVCQADAIPAGSPPSCVPDSTGNFSFFGIGGTSASSPSFAGIIALIGQSEAAAGRSRRQGNANLVLYKIAATPANSCNSSTTPLTGSSTCAFYDVTKGNNSVPCAGGSPNCSSTTSANGVLVSPASATTPAFSTTAGTGSITTYNLATGLGTMNVANLARAWGTAVGSFKSTTSTLLINGSATPGPITHGTAVTAKVTVAPVAPATGTPTGDVSVLPPGGTFIGGGRGEGTLASGTVTINGVILPGGNPTNVTAHYVGDGTFGASDSAVIPVTVNKENSRLQYGIVTFDPVTGNITNTNATSFTYGSPYILRMDILNSTTNACTPLAVTPVLTGCAFDARGTVTITDTFNGSTNPLDTGTFKINSEGSAEDQPIQLPAGMHALSATYSGDNSYNPNDPVASNLTVAQAATTTTLTASTTTAVVNNQFGLTADVKTNSNGVAPSCSAIVFKDGSTVLNLGGDCIPNAGSASGPAETIFLAGIIATTTGTHSYTATYTGETNYLSSVSNSQSVTVKLGTTLSVQAVPSQIVSGQSTTLTGLVDTGNRPPTPGPTGTVTFTGSTTGQIKSSVACTATTDASGNEACQASVSYSPASSETVTATYSGDTNYAANNFSPPTVIQVTQPTFSISGASTTVMAGGSGSSTISVVSNGFTGTVAVTCPAGNLPPGVSCGAANVTVTTANTNTNPATGQLTVAVAAPSAQNAMAWVAPTERTLYTAGPIPPRGGKGWWALSAITGLMAIILLLLPGRKKYRAALGLALVCVLSFTLGCGGGYGGGGGGGPVATATHIMVTSATKAAAGATFTFKATVTGGTPTDNVQLYDGTTPTGAAVAVSGGTATLTTAALNAVGTHSITARYAGDATYTQASASGALSVTVTGPTTFSIQASPAASNGSPTINLTIN